MHTRRSKTLIVYRLLILLYPKSYREAYGADMILDMQGLIAAASRPREKIALLVLAAHDYATTLLSQNVQALESTVEQANPIVRQGSFSSLLLVAPFYIVCSYNSLVVNLFHHTNTLANWEARHWVVYCAVLPLIAAAIVILLAMYQFRLSGEQQSAQPGRSSVANWLLILVPVIFIACIMVL